MKTKKILVIALGFLFSYPNVIKAQSHDQGTISKADQQATIDSVSHLLNSAYVFPEVAKQMGDLIGMNYKNGSYSTISDPIIFAQKLTEDLQSVSKDKHIQVRFHPENIKPVKPQQEKPDNDAMAEQLRMMNYGFKEVKMLDGNIGYLDLRLFIDPQFAGETAAAAMNFLSNSSALIIDLRKNGGGNTGMIQLITSYLFGPKPVHLNNFYFRSENLNKQTWTLPYINGKRRPDMDVYVLTSKSSFSAAEEFTYDLKNLHRATIIGEVTGGAANPGGELAATEHFSIFVPTGSVTNPITKTNWEGTGVQPDIQVPAAAALDTAMLKALEKLALKNVNKANNIYSWLYTSYKAKQQPISLNNSQLKTYTGTFGPKTVSLKNGNLLYHQRDQKFKLTPLGKDIFELAEDNSVRVEFKKENGKVSNITLYRANGNSEKYSKSKS